MSAAKGFYVQTLSRSWIDECSVDRNTDGRVRIWLHSDDRSIAIALSPHEAAAVAGMLSEAIAFVQTVGPSGEGVLFKWSRAANEGGSSPSGEGGER